MCAVSAVSDNYRDRYPYPHHFPRYEYPDYLDALEKARKYDELMGQKDCPHPEKLEWQRQLEEYMRKNYGLEPRA